MRSVVLTNERGEDIGTAEIVAAHANGGQLHKAFSIFLFDPTQTMALIQQRSTKKMLFPLFWANTCCSHPYPGEDIAQAARRRLDEECGLTAPDLSLFRSFIYKADDPEGRGTEYEHDTIFVGHVSPDADLTPDPEEIAEIAWVPVAQLRERMCEEPARYAPWFHEGLAMILDNDERTS